jgi:hypothetical protein
MELVNLLHKVKTSSADDARIRQILETEVPIENYHQSWSELPASVRCIVPKRETVIEINDEAARQRKEKIQIHNQAVLDPNDLKNEVTSEAQDHVETSPGSTGKPDPSVKFHINHGVLEPESLYLSEGGVYNFTYNDKSQTPPRFTQGQGCIVKKINFPKPGDFIFEFAPLFQNTND